MSILLTTFFSFRWYCFANQTLLIGASRYDYLTRCQRSPADKHTKHHRTDFPFWARVHTRRGKCSTLYSSVRRGCIVLRGRCRMHISRWYPLSIRASSDASTCTRPISCCIRHQPLSRSLHAPRVPRFPRTSGPKAPLGPSFSPARPSRSLLGYCLLPLREHAARRRVARRPAARAGAALLTGRARHAAAAAVTK